MGTAAHRNYDDYGWSACVRECTLVSDLNHSKHDVYVNFQCSPLNAMRWSVHHSRGAGICLVHCIAVLEVSGVGKHQCGCSGLTARVYAGNTPSCMFQHGVIKSKQARYMSLSIIIEPLLMFVTPTTPKGSTNEPSMGCLAPM